MEGVWRLNTAAPGDKLHLSVAVQHPSHGAFFDAVLTLTRVPSLPCSLQRWLLGRPQRVAVWIYWQAVVLLWKGVPLYGHPKDTGASVTAYRHTAAAAVAAMHPHGVMADQRGGKAGAGGGGCPAAFVWRESKGYPWD